MKNLLLLFFLFPLFIQAQTFEYNGSSIEFTDLKGEFHMGTTGKTGRVEFTDSTIVYFEYAGEMSLLPYSDTLKIINVAIGANYSVSYLVNGHKYFILYPTEILYVREAGGIWLYENLQIK
jgi:hypothetical protein